MCSSDLTEYVTRDLLVSLHRMEGMSCDSTGVRALLAAITSKLENSTTVLDRTEYLNAIKGLRRMKKEFVEVKELFAILSKLADEKKIPSNEFPNFSPPSPTVPHPLVSKLSPSFDN